MKQTTRLLALSALVLAVMLGVFGAPALEAPGVAHAQGTVPAAPTGLSAQRSGASTINLSWTAVSGAARYQVYSWDAVDEWTRLDGGADNPHTTTTFSHTGLTANRLYYYQVYAVNAQGDRGPRSNRVNEVAGQNAPNRPVLTVTPGYLVNVISWPAVTSPTAAVSYELYAWDQSWSRVGGDITGTSYTHTGLTAGQTYYYEARAVNGSGVKSAYSIQASATVLTTPTVTAPVNLSAGTTPQDQQVTLTWQSPPGAGAAITGYQYRYAESSAALPDTWTDAGMDMTETITGLTNGTQYTFEVRAMSSTGEGPAASVMATPAAVPDAPALTATEGYRLVMLSWEAPDDNGAMISAYHVEILNAQNRWMAETSLPGSATSYTDRGLNDSAVYTYRIIAENAAGRSSASNSAAATTLAQPAQPPGAPHTISAVPGAGMVTLTWMTPLTTGGSPITRYEYRYKEMSASSFGQWMSNMLELTVAVKPLKPGTEYDFEVRAVNAAGAGEALKLPPDEAGRATTTTARTPTATGPTAVPVLRAPVVGAFTGGTVADHESRATITLSWAALPLTANGGDTAAITYEICYKKSTDSAWMRWDSANPGFPAITAPASGSVWTAVHGDDSGKLDPGTTYEYRARGLNSVATAGTAATCTHWDGDWSNVVRATTPIVKPAAPTLHPAAGATDQAAWTLNVNSITIRWTAPEDTGGADITSYEVWVGTTMVADASTLTPTVTNLPPSRTEYISIGLTASTTTTPRTYYYRVRARNGSGADRVGAWSDEVGGATTVTQTGTPGAPGTPSTVPTAATGDVAVTWTAPTEQGTTPITSYEIQYQRTDDFADEDLADATADAADWDDAMTGAPTPPAALTWTHMKAPGDSTFSYRVRAVNGSGAGAWSEAGTATVGARIADAPMLTATAVGDDEIMLQWNIPGNNGTPITGFEIQQWDPDLDPAAWATANLLATGAPDGGSIADVPTLTVFIVDELNPGTKYYFRIRATGTTPGAWSAESMADAASATTTAGAPGMPTLTVGDGTAGPTGETPPAAPTADSITLWWAAPTSGGSDITGYQLRIWDGTDWVLEANLPATAWMYKDEGLAPGTRQYYILAATNGVYGPWSDAATAMTEAGNPDAPMLTATATGTTSIRLTWNVPDANGATISGYQLQRWDASLGTPAWGATNLLTDSAIAVTDAETVTEFEDTGLTAGTTYYYRIRALPQVGDDGSPDDEAGWSATDMSDGASATTQGGAGPPTLAAPSGITASQITITWTAPTQTGGTAITGYTVQIYDRASSMWIDEATLGNVLTYTDMNLVAGTKYYYRVRAMNGQVGGQWSAYVSGTTTAGSPAAPVLTATATGMTTIRLTWNVPAYNGATVTEYVLQKWDAGATPPAWDTATNLLGTTAADTIGLTLHVDSGLMPGTTYYYRIRVMPQTGEAGWSTIKSATTVAGAPGRPTLTAEADGQNAIDLSWTAAMANGSAIVRYELQVWDADNSRWMNVRNDLPSTRTTYKHSGLTAETRYVYRVRGVNSAADNNGFGKWSVITFATTAK